jgi:hypothetical protein
VEFNYAALAVAAVASFVISSVWYVVFDRQRAQLLGGAVTDAPADARPQPWKIILELVRSLIVATVLAGLSANLGVATWMGALQLGAAAWIGFPFVLLTGSVIWDGVPWRLAAIHAGDWLVKLLVVAVMVGVWH